MKVRNTYILLVTIIGLFTLALYSTFAMFTASFDVGEFVSISASNLPTDTSMLEYERLTIEAGETKIIDLNINNKTTNSLYYGTWYEMIDPTTKIDTIVIAKLDTGENPTFGQLTTNSSKKVTILLQNKTTNSFTINMGVAYSLTSSLNLPTNRYLITDEASDAIDGSEVAPATYDFNYTGAVQQQTLTKGKYKLEVWGAEGGYRTNATYSGKGGYSYGTLTLDTTKDVFVYVGGAGNTGKTAGGFNGGGARTSYNGGGGASDIRFTGGTWSDQTSLLSRIIVAGGGGSDGQATKKGMYGGGTTGGSTTENYGTGGYGGTQTGVSNTSWQTTTKPTSLTAQAGAYAGFGFGGNGINRSSGYGGAGGGGWYGGSGSYPDTSGDDDRGGAGGSGYVWTSSTASSVPSGYSVPTTYYLTDAKTIAGNTSFTSPSGTNETGHTGDGHARITKIVTAPSLNGLTEKTVIEGTTFDLSSDVTCVNNGEGCKIASVKPSNTKDLAIGTYTVIYIVTSNDGTRYKYTRNLKVTEEPVLASTKIIKLSKGDTWESGASGVYQTNGHEYRYIGANVNNYVSFNNDLYRIIGVFDENSHGVKGQNLVKLIAANPLGADTYGNYNSSNTSGTYSNYENDWTGGRTGVKANLNVLLNEYFYNKTNTSSTYGVCANWTYYSSNNNYRTNDCSDIVGYGINTNLKNYVENTTWYLYGYTGSGLSKQNFYLCERGQYTGCTSANSGLYSTSTKSPIGLMYISDYMYASGYYSNSDTTTGSSYNYGNQNWLFKGNEWTIIPRSNTSASTLYVNYISNVNDSNASSGYNTRPTFYLKSNVNITGGDGTFDNPYTLSV